MRRASKIISEASSRRNVDYSALHPFFTEPIHFMCVTCPDSKVAVPTDSRHFPFSKKTERCAWFLFHWRSPRRYFLKARSTLVSIVESGTAFCLRIVVSAADFVFCRRAG